MPMNRGFQMGASDAPKRRVRRWQIPRAAMAIPACGVGHFRRRRFQPLSAARKMQQKRQPVTELPFGLWLSLYLVRTFLPFSTTIPL